MSTRKDFQSSGKSSIWNLEIFGDICKWFLSALYLCGLYSSLRRYGSPHCVVLVIQYSVIKSLLVLLRGDLSSCKLTHRGDCLQASHVTQTVTAPTKILINELKHVTVSSKPFLSSQVWHAILTNEFKSVFTRADSPEQSVLCGSVRYSCSSTHLICSHFQMFTSCF